MSTHTDPVTGEEVDLDPQDFLVTLNDALRPEVLDECASKFAELVAAVHAYRRKGRLLIEVAITPSKKVPDSAEIIAAVKTVLPEPDREARIRYVAPDGRLRRDDPRQSKIPGLSDAVTSDADGRPTDADEAS